MAGGSLDPAGLGFFDLRNGRGEGVLGLLE